MKSDLDKSKDELVQELGFLRRKVAEADELRRRLEEVQTTCNEVESSYETRTAEFNNECTIRDQTEEALRMAEVIVDRSPVILFRRLAGDQPRLEYVSDNIRQMGYAAEAFISGEISFRDIVHPDDMEKLGEEIREYAEADVEE
jgi:sigma-B regulation protein RsbU (phosphoserine phosphatase)